MNTHVTCQDILDALYELANCERHDRHSGLVDAGSVPGPDARTRALIIKHVATCTHCTDALDAKRHVCALLRGCYESEQASDALHARVVASVTNMSIIWHQKRCDNTRSRRGTRADEPGATTRFSTIFVAVNGLCLDGLGRCMQKCSSSNNKPKKNDMLKQGRERRDHCKNGANHGKCPSA